jgi:two-component system chemotaxis response regulator CheY
MKMMTVDDSAVVRKIISGAVEVLGYECIEAEDAEDALCILENEFNDLGLIFLDWNMPGINGLELLKKLKADPRYKKIPVMMVTTESVSLNIIEAVKAGASHYITKPFAMEELLKKILECLGKGAM